LATNSKLTDVDAVGFVTWNIADIFGLRQSNGVPLGVLSAGQPAELVAYDGNPFEIGTKVQLVAGGGRRGVICQKDVEQM
jgi:imidazolonepropionase-like amidohydrolase